MRTAIAAPYVLEAAWLYLPCSYLLTYSAPTYDGAAYHAPTDHAPTYYGRLAASLEPRTPSLAAATRAYAAAAHADANTNADAGADAGAGAGAVADEADVDVDGIALCSPASLLSTPGSLPSLTTPGRAGETPRPSCLVSPGGGAAQPSLLD